MSQQMPVNTGRVDGPHVIVDRCVVCGASHIHGNVGFEDGEDTRAPHCGVPSEPTSYKIVLEGQQ